VKSPSLPFIFIISLFLLLASCSTKVKEEYNKVTIGDIDIHYQIHGIGSPLIFIHGSLADLRYWKDQTPFLDDHFQVITYSRRYNYPNVNNLQPSHSANVEAADLLRLMDKLKIERAYIVGHSYGAYTALLFALEHPTRVSKLVLAEPPIMKWLPDIPGGEGKEEKFMADTWKPIGKAFRDQGEQAGLDLTSMWYFKAPMDSISAEWQTNFTDNAKEWHALTISDNPFPMVDYQKVKDLNIPVLLLSGSKSQGNMNSLIDGHLSRLLPNSRHTTIQDVGHEMFIENPNASNKAIFNFLRQ